MQIGRKIRLKTEVAVILRRKQAEVKRIQKIVKAQKKKKTGQQRKLNEYIKKLDRIAEIVERPYVSTEDGQLLFEAISTVLQSMGLTDLCISGALRRKLPKIQTIIVLVRTPTGRMTIDRNLFSVKMAEMGHIVNHFRKNTKAERVYSMQIAGILTRIVAVSPENKGGILLYTTGNQAFLRLMIAQAHRMGYRLVKEGLYHMGQLIPCDTEEEIFDELLVEYVPPEDRDYGLQKKILPFKKIMLTNTQIKPKTVFNNNE